MRLRRRPAGPATPPLQDIKLRAIDAAMSQPGVHSVVDLGGVWAVEGGYTFYALERHQPLHAVLVDDDITPAVRERARRHPALQLVEANFGAVETVERVGSADAVLLFDVLLHQVDPDWDRILTRWSESATAVAVVQPQWVHGDHVVRLVDLGEAEYLASVPPMPEHDALFARIDEINPRRGRRWRDVHDVWQWGITDADLIAHMDGLGFDVVHRENGGTWNGLPRFEAHALVFARRDA